MNKKIKLRIFNLITILNLKYNQNFKNKNFIKYLFKV